MMRRLTDGGTSWKSMSHICSALRTFTASADIGFDTLGILVLGPFGVFLSLLLARRAPALKV